ncbi:MAG: lamin tail domain-containing protein, partial [Chitinophagales bacterium]
LYNPSPTPINLSDFVFSNKQFYNNFKIPVNTVIDAGGYLVVAEDKAEFMSQHPGVINVIGDFIFNLQNDGDSVTFSDFLGNTIETFSFNDKHPWPITPDGHGRTMEIAATLAAPELSTSWFAGCLGGSPGEPFALCYENPIVDEINYKSSPTEDADDWFELFNSSATDFDLSGWKIKDKNKNTFTIPNGVSIAAGGYLVFYQDEAKFNAQFPGIINKVGALNFGFSGEGDVILIYDSTNKLYQSVGYDDEAPFPLSPDGGGFALQIVNPVLNLNDASNWMESCPEGSPGTEFILPCANSINDEETVSIISIYPNPANELIAISAPAEINGNSMVNIFDLAGKKIISTEVNTDINRMIDISILPAGLYHLQMINDGNKFTASFIKE